MGLLNAAQSLLATQSQMPGYKLPSLSIGPSEAKIRINPSEGRDRTPPIKAADLTSAAEGLSKFEESKNLLDKAAPYFNSVPASLQQMTSGGTEQGAATISPYARIGASNFMNAVGAGGVMDPQKLEAANAFTQLNRNMKTIQTVYARVLHGSVRNKEFVNNAIASVPDFAKGADQAAPVIEHGLRTAYSQTIELILDAQKQGMDRNSIIAAFGGEKPLSSIFRNAMERGIIKPQVLLEGGWIQPAGQQQPQAAPQGAAQQQGFKRITF